MLESIEANPSKAIDMMSLLGSLDSKSDEEFTAAVCKVLPSEALGCFAERLGITRSAGKAARGFCVMMLEDIIALETILQGRGQPQNKLHLVSKRLQVSRQAKQSHLTSCVLAGKRRTQHVDAVISRAATVRNVAAAPSLPSMTSLLPPLCATETEQGYCASGQESRAPSKGGFLFTEGAVATPDVQNLTQTGSRSPKKAQSAPAVMPLELEQPAMQLQSPSAGSAKRAGATRRARSAAESPNTCSTNAASGTPYGSSSGGEEVLAGVATPKTPKGNRIHNPSKLR